MSTPVKRANGPHPRDCPSCQAIVEHLIEAAAQSGQTPFDCLIDLGFSSAVIHNITVINNIINNISGGRPE